MYATAPNSSIAPQGPEPDIRFLVSWTPNTPLAMTDIRLLNNDDLTARDYLSLLGEAIGRWLCYTADFDAARREDDEDERADLHEPEPAHPLQPRVVWQEGPYRIVEELDFEEWFASYSLQAQADGSLWRPVWRQDDISIALVEMLVRALGQRSASHR